MQSWDELSEVNPVQTSWDDLLEKPPEDPRGVVGAVTDTALEVGSGAAKGIKFMADAFGADNPVSKTLDEVSIYAKGLQSAQAKGEDARMSAIMQEAQDKGIWDQVKAAFDAASEAPVRQSIGAVATGLPMIAASMLPGVREASWGARMATVGGMGAVQGAGMAKDSIRDSVYERAKSEGLDEPAAAVMADRAQEYGGGNTDQIALSAALGGATTATGLTPAIMRSIAKDGIKRTVAPSLARELGMGVVKEAPLEAIQGGQEQFAGNLAQDRAGYDTPLTRGVVGQAVLEGALAAPGGVVGGALDYAAKPADILKAPTIDDAIAKFESVGKAWQDLGIAPTTGSLETQRLAEQAGESWQDLEIGDQAGSLAEQRALAVAEQAGQAYQALGPTDPLDDLAAQKRISEVGAQWQGIEEGKKTQFENLKAEIRALQQRRLNAANTAGQEYQSLGITDPLDDLAKQKQEEGIGPTTMAQRWDQTRRDNKIAQVGQQYKDLGITDPQGDLESQRKSTQVINSVGQQSQALDIKSTGEVSAVINEQNSSPPIGPQTQAAPTQTPAPTGESAPTSVGIPAAGTAAATVEANGVVDATPSPIPSSNTDSIQLQPTVASASVDTRSGTATTDAANTGGATAANVGAPAGLSAGTADQTVNFPHKLLSTGNVIVYGDPMQVRKAFTGATGTTIFAGGKPAGVTFAVSSTPSVLEKLNVDRTTSQRVDSGARPALGITPKLPDSNVNEAGVLRSGQGAGAPAPGNPTAARLDGLRLADTVPDEEFAKLRRIVNVKKGVDFDRSERPLNYQQTVVSKLAHKMGKTVTWIERKSGKVSAMPDGFINQFGGKHLFIDVDAQHPFLEVVIHEGTHGLPEHIRSKLKTTTLKLVSQEGQTEFFKKYGYTKDTRDVKDEEITAFLAQRIAKRPEFVQDLRTVLGNRDFAVLAKAILEKIKRWFSQDDTFDSEFLDKHVSDVKALHDAVVGAYAQSMQEQGLQPDDIAAPAFANKKVAVGAFEMSQNKDGSIVVHGPADEVRANLPEGITGRVVENGVAFTNSDAPRVRHALEGNKTAYSRAGEVTEKLALTQDGKYLGAPDKFNTPGKIPHLRKWLTKLTKEGEAGRFWYENSSKAVLRMVGGDVQEARRFVALLAIYSPQAKVDTNSTFALRAWSQYKAGRPISVKTGVMDKKAQSALDNVDEYWSGEKTGNFFTNLLTEIDPATRGKQGATIDMWMMRAAQYDSDAPTKTQYAFMENETNRIAREFGWELQQVQAAIWVAMKARMENDGVKKATEAKSEKSGWIHYAYPLKNGKPQKTRVVDKPQEHRDNWLEHAISHDPSGTDTQRAKFDFEDGLRRHIGQVSWEARPGRSTGVLPGVNDAPYDQQVEFQQAVQKALQGPGGEDLLAQQLGLLMDGDDLLAPGVWQGEVAAGMQKQIAMAPAKGGEFGLDSTQKKNLDLYSAVLGLLLRQEGVGWHRPFYNGNKSGENGVELRIGSALSPEQAKELWSAIDKRMLEKGVADWEQGAGMISSPVGMRVVNFGALEDNKTFRQLVEDATEDTSLEAHAVHFTSDGNLVMNNWVESPNGQDFVKQISDSGRPDLLGWSRDVLAPRVQRVFDEFSEKYDWGDPGSIAFSNKAEDGLGGVYAERGPGPRAHSVRVNGTHFSLQGRTSLDGRYFGQGLKGAEQSRLAESTDSRIKERVYFYVDEGKGVTPEAGVGAVAHTASLDNLYNTAGDPLKLFKSGDANGSESRVLDAGFDGYYFPNYSSNQGIAVVLGKASRGIAVAQSDYTKGATPVAPEPPYKRGLTSKELNAIDLAAVQTAAPSAKLRMGTFSVDRSELDAARETLAKQGIDLPAGGPAFSNKAAPFYSALSKEIGNLNYKALPVVAWRDAIKGLVNKGLIKQDEVEWSGLTDWLGMQEGKVTRDQVVQYLDANGVTVKETVLGSQESDVKDLNEELDAQYGYGASLDYGDVVYTDEAGDTVDYRDLPTQVKRIVDEHSKRTGGSSKFDDYKLAGGENYREVLLTLPQKKEKWVMRQVPSGKWEVLLEDGSRSLGTFKTEGSAGSELDYVNRTASEDPKSSYTSSHWDQKNVLAHMRVDDRTDAEGNRVLFVQELQSDWGQAKRDGKSVPNAPLIGTTDKWLGLALKRVMVMAAQGGYDKVAFVTGDQSVNNYPTLEKQLDRVEVSWSRAERDTVNMSAFDPRGNLVARELDIPRTKLDEYIGKDVAVRANDQLMEYGQAKLKGLDLKTGGEGMREFYDSIVPAAIKPLLKKLGGGQMETVELDTRTPEDDSWTSGITNADILNQPGFSITDAMREKAGEGLPLFSNKRQTETPEFKKWFGDSKVVDADGKPLVVYHGTAVDLEGNAFNENLAKSEGGAFYFSHSPLMKNPATNANEYAAGRVGDSQQVMPVFLSIKNPLITGFTEPMPSDDSQIEGWLSRMGDFNRSIDDTKERYYQRAIREARASGNDGVIIRGVEDVPNDAGRRFTDETDVYIVFKPTQIKSATGNNGKFDGANPDIRYSNKRIVGDKGRQYTAAQLQAMDNTGARVDEPTLKERAQALTKDLGKKLAQGIADQFAPVKALDGTAYGLLRLAKGASGAFEALLQGGKLKLTDNVYDIDTTARGGVVDELLKPLNGEHHDFLRWVAAHRAEALGQVGKENLFTAADIAAFKTLADGTTNFDYTIKHGARRGQVTRDRTLIYNDSQTTFKSFNKNVLDMAEQSGLIDGSTRHMWESEFYVPFYRVADDADGGVRGMNIKGAAVRQQAFKALKGGKNALNADLLENTLMNWAHLLDASAKNRAAKATIDAAEAMGIATTGDQATLAQMATSIHNKNGVVWFMDGGQKRYSLIDNQGDGEYIMTALSALEYAGMRNPVMNAMGAMKHALTVGVTASPFFKVKNLIRDSVQVIGTGQISYNPAANVKQGWKLTDPKSDAYFRLLAGGGTIHFGTMMEGSEAKRVQALVDAGVDQSTILNSDAKLKTFYNKVVKGGWEAYNELGNRGEAVNRASLYDQLRKQGVNHADASLQARDLMDFSMQGSWTSVRFLTQVVPFMNARIQGLYKLGRASKEDPARIAAVIGATTLFSLALLAAYSDDDDWKKRTDSDRNNFWWFKFGGTAYRIPKPFEIGSIATLAERGFELAFDKEMTSKQFMKNVKELLGDNLAMNPVPQLVKPILDVYANRDSFSGMPIENMAQERLKSEYRFNDRTTMFARGASTALNKAASLAGEDSLSPVQIDHMLRGYFGWLGTFVVSGADIIARPATGQATQATPDYIKVLSGNMVSDLRDAPSKYVSHMYDQAKAIEEAHATWRSLLKEGKTAEAKEFRDDNTDLLKKYRKIESVKRKESAFNERIRVIERSNMSADAKRDLIRSIRAQKDRAARQGM